MDFLLKPALKYFLIFSVTLVMGFSIWLLPHGTNNKDESVSITTPIDVPGEPHGLTHSPDGKTVYVGQRKLGQISMIDTASRKITKTTSLGQRPDMIAISSDGKTLYVAIRDENKLAVVSAVDLSLTIKIDTDGETHGVAYRDN